LESDELTKPEHKQHVFDNPRNVARLLRGLYLICFFLFLLDFILHRHVALRWEVITGFYPLFGFVACVTLVLVAKQMRKVLMRKEDYYDVDD
jgi:hypothetical protein